MHEIVFSGFVVGTNLVTAHVGVGLMGLGGRLGKGTGGFVLALRLLFTDLLILRGVVVGGYSTARVGLIHLAINNHFLLLAKSSDFGKDNFP